MQGADVSVTLESPYVWVSGGDRLWIDPRRCSHSNSDVCATCDHDRYYATKHGHMCPWFTEEEVG